MDRAERLDFELLLNRLEDVVQTGSHVPFSARVLVDQQDCLGIIDQMRLALPKELEQARRILAEQDAIMEQARTEAESIAEEARKHVTREALAHEIVREARIRAAEIDQQAQDGAVQARREADEYARQLLQRLTSRVEQTLRSLRTGVIEMERATDETDELDGEMIADHEPVEPAKRPRRRIHR
jgi:hypothetical protein